MSTETDTGDGELQKRRREIDAVDSELLRLLNQRARIAFELAAIKQSSGLPVYDGRREQQILERICAENPGPLGPSSLTSIFRCIIRESRKTQHRSMRRGKQKSVPTGESQW
jgi:chorismate mutase